MINKELGLALDAIIKDAKKRRHEYLTAEHILFALIHDELGIDIITGCGGDVARIKLNIEAFFDKNIPVLPPGSSSNPVPAAGFQRVIHKAIVHVQSADKAEVEAGICWRRFMANRILSPHIFWSRKASRGLMC